MVVGGGEIAERKVLSLLDCDAQVTVVSPRLTGGLQEIASNGGIAHINRSYLAGDIDGMAVVISATDDLKINRLVAEECLARGVLINVVDNPSLCNFYVPAVVRRGDLTISISTNGKSPLLARRIREQLEREFGPEYVDFLILLGDARQEIINKFPDPGDRRQAIARLVESDLLELIRRGEEERVKERIAECTSW